MVHFYPPTFLPLVIICGYAIFLAGVVHTQKNYTNLLPPSHQTGLQQLLLIFLDNRLTIVIRLQWRKMEYTLFILDGFLSGHSMQTARTTSTMQTPQLFALPSLYRHTVFLHIIICKVDQARRHCNVECSLNRTLQVAQV